MRRCGSPLPADVPGTHCKSDGDGQRGGADASVRLLSEPPAPPPALCPRPSWGLVEPALSLKAWRLGARSFTGWPRPRSTIAGDWTEVRPCRIKKAVTFGDNSPQRRYCASQPRSSETRSRCGCCAPHRVLVIKNRGNRVEYWGSDALSGPAA